MGTNFYLRRIPTKERKEEIKKAIDDNQYERIEHLISETYTNPYYDSETNGYVGGNIHLGKRSSGWKFLWNPNWYRLIEGHFEYKDIDEGVRRGNYVVDNENKVFKFYDLTKESLQNFIFQDNSEIFDEYGDKQDKEDFWKMALEWCQEDGWDGETYNKWEKEQNPNYVPLDYSTDYTRFLEANGCKLNKYKTDFYSDGLRFSTCTEFS